MSYVIGVDEAGRGPLAGPLAVGFIAIPDDFDLLTLFPGLNDSKQVTPKKREALFELLETVALKGEVRYHIEWIPAATLDAQGLTAPIQSAVARGVRTLLPNPKDGKVFLDGLLKAPEEYMQETIPGGDAQVPAIMLASIVAKVLRDRHMEILENAHPGYGFGKHKGYGTKAHYEAIRTLGPCPEHRRLFLRKFSI